MIIIITINLFFKTSLTRGFLFPPLVSAAHMFYQEAGGTNRRCYQLTQDLKAVNKIVKPRFLCVPNPNTILTSIPCSATLFAIVDLYSDSFSTPLHPNSRYLFSFTWKNHEHTVIVMPQGFTGRPSLFCGDIICIFKGFGIALQFNTQTICRWLHSLFLFDHVCDIVFFLFFFYKFIYLFLAVLGLRFLCEGFLQLW